MTAQCVEDPTIVACTGEDAGRQYDTAPEPVPAQDHAVSVEVGSVDTTPSHVYLASTGDVGTVVYLTAALMLTSVGVRLVAWAHTKRMRQRIE